MIKSNLFKYLKKKRMRVRKRIYLEAKKLGLEFKYNKRLLIGTEVSFINML